MKQISKISGIGMLMGAIFSLISFLRYYLGLAGGYVDVDKSVAYILVGFLVISVSYLYERVKRLELESLAQGDKISDIIYGLKK